MTSRFLVFLFCIFQFSAGAAVAFDIAPLSGPVVDDVGLLSSGQRRQIEESLFAFKRNHAIQIQVYIIKSLQGEDIASAAIKVFDQWKLGNEKTDKGLLFLIAPNDRRMRIEVGQGLEGDIPDVIAKRIVADVVRPYFQKGEYALGISQGINAIQTRLIGEAEREQGQAQGQTVQPTDDGGKGPGFWIFIIIAGIWLLIFITNPSLALYLLFSGLRGGGGGGGDSWGGGGGRSSGGGASGDW